MRVADIIAYLNHDIDDAMRGNVIHGDDLPKESREYLGESSSDRIDTMVRGVIQEALNDSENKSGFSEGLNTALSPCEIFFMIEYMIA